MKQKHKSLYEQDRIKIYNSSILDFNKKINEQCFVIGMEILDNMPHDRLFSDGDQFTKQAMIHIDNQDGNEVLRETHELIDDPLVKDFLKYLETMPDEDHITVHNKM